MKIKQEIKHIVQTNGPNKEIRARQSHARLEVIMKHKETYNVTHQIDTPWRNDERRLANVRKKKRAVKLRKWKRMVFIDEAIFRDQSSAGSFIFTIPSETKRTINVYISLFFFDFFFYSFSLFLFLGNRSGDWLRPVETSWLWFRGMCHSIQRDRRWSHSSTISIKRVKPTDVATATKRKKGKK